MLGIGVLALMKFDVIHCCPVPEIALWWTPWAALVVCAAPMERLDCASVLSKTVHWQHVHLRVPRLLSKSLQRSPCVHSWLTCGWPVGHNLAAPHWQAGAVLPAVHRRCEHQGTSAAMLPKAAPVPEGAALYISAQTAQNVTSPAADAQLVRRSKEIHKWNLAPECYSFCRSNR